jgi:AcrR family transcriptional regulator
VAETAHPVKAPCQQRSRDSQERILRAAESLIKSKGFEALTTAEVVRRSRTSIGTLYARFGDKTALLHAVQDRVQSREEAAMRTELAKVDWSSLTLEESVRRLLQIKQVATEGDGRLFEAFVVHGATDPVLRAQGYRHKATIEGLEVDVLMRHADEFGHPDPQEAARVASRLAQAAQEEYVQRSLSGLELPASVRPDLLLQRLAEVIIAYLKSPQAAVRPSLQAGLSTAFEAGSTSAGPSLL